MPLREVDGTQSQAIVWFILLLTEMLRVGLSADYRSSLNYIFVTPSRLEAFWRAQGTDEDIIFLRKPKPKDTRESRIKA